MNPLNCILTPRTEYKHLLLWAHKLAMPGWLRFIRRPSAGRGIDWLQGLRAAANTLEREEAETGRGNVEYDHAHDAVSLVHIGCLSLLTDSQTFASAFYHSHHTVNNLIRKSRERVVSRSRDV